MRNRALISVAALIASASLAYAQDAPSPAPNGSKNMAPAEKIETPSASDKAPGQMKVPGNSAKDAAPGQLKGAKESAKDLAPGQNKASEKASDASRDADKSAVDPRNSDSDRKANRDAVKSDGRAGDTSAPDASKADMKADARDGSKDGSKTAYKSVTGEQRTKLTSTFSRHRVEPARNLNFSINVGVSVPRDVRFYAIPADIVVFVPEYRNYRYFLVGDQICIVDPVTYEIVDIIVIA